MNIFTYFFTQLDAQLALFLSAQVAVVAAAIEPAAVKMAVIYVMVWGWLSMSGRIQEPFWEGVRRILTIAIVLGCGIRLWLYSSVVVDTFTNGPSQLAQAILGANSTVSLVEQIWFEGNLTGQALWTAGAWNNLGSYLASLGVYAVIGIVCAVTAGLLALAKIATTVLLVIGPVFIVMLLFQATKRFFENWVGQLANYSLITIILAVIGSMLLKVVLAFATSAAASGAAVTIAEIAGMCVMALAMLFVLWQTPSIASGLAAGVALGSYGVISRALNWGMNTAQQGARGAIEGAAGVPRGKMDSVPRLAGSVMGQVVRGAFVNGPARQGGTVSRDRVMPPRIAR